MSKTELSNLSTMPGKPVRVALTDNGFILQATKWPSPLP